MSRVLPRALLVLLALTAGACGDDDNSTPIAPTPPTTTTETFAGTVNPNGAVTHPFSTFAAGSVTVTLSTLSPEGSVIGLSLGTWNGAFCQIILANDQAVQGSVVIGNASSLGSLCARVYDVGRLSENASYELTVVHP
jgi:hypothetical protein